MWCNTLRILPNFFWYSSLSLEKYRGPSNWSIRKVFNSQQSLRSRHHSFRSLSPSTWFISSFSNSLASFTCFFLSLLYILCLWICGTSCTINLLENGFGTDLYYFNYVNYSVFFVQITYGVVLYMVCSIMIRMFSDIRRVILLSFLLPHSKYIW